MALPPQNTPAQQQSAAIGDAFLADRSMFWSRFTGFTKGAIIAVVALLLGMLIFLA